MKTLFVLCMLGLSLTASADSTVALDLNTRTLLASSDYAENISKLQKDCPGARVSTITSKQVCFGEACSQGIIVEFARSFGIESKPVGVLKVSFKEDETETVVDQYELSSAGDDDSACLQKTE